MEFYVALVNDKKLCTNFTRRFIIGVAEVLGTPLKLANLKSLKMNIRHCRNMSKTKRKLVNQCFGRKADFPRGIFFGGKIPGVIFRGYIYEGQLSEGLFSRENFSGHRLFYINLYELHNYVNYNNCIIYELYKFI